MTSDRPYRKGMSFSAAARILADGRGTQWDSTIVDAFVEQVIPLLLSQRETASPPRTPAVDGIATPAGAESHVAA